MHLIGLARYSSDLFMLTHAAATNEIAEFRRRVWGAQIK